ncbi:hypothetical protein [Geodermatophilus sabuli]|uniref:Chromosome segregation ATPase n=1 Tax=Geodermatophilus sabuli TaxID=1564158 RepID=A0A285EC20_9ACTN|nr:hypothetical protein [Geodermatophilus sabuli]MBB3084191.1 hypothetical protein [Geodermatophilus sabuli]SNX96537.1 hypothetical protein SAMN06893097_104252 [Geodermatophilus sabuli]
MSYQLSRVRLANVGDRAARFHDVTLDLAAPAAAGGDPLDSILWLRNGGGKSSLLSLFFALVLPLRRDFLGATVKRYLEDYVSDGDTSHTVAEWSDGRGDALFDDGQRLVTGAVYEWEDRRKPADPDRNRDKLKVTYYAFTATPGVLTLDTLPLTEADGRPTDRAGYVRRLRNLAAEYPQQLQLVTTEGRSQWMTALTERHLDPQLFRYQKKMNHSEGGVAELFTFDTPGKFIDLLIDLTVDPGEPDLVAKNLRDVADILAAKPRHQLGAQFCETLAGKLDALAAEHTAATDARDAARDAAENAHTVAASLAAAANLHTATQQRLNGSVPGLLEASREADRERTRLGAISNELLLRAEGFRHIAATAELEKRTALARGAARTVAAWEAVGPLAEQSEAIEQAAELRRQLEAEEEANAPKRDRRDEAALALRTRYRSLQATEAGQDAETTAEATAAAAEGRRLRAEQRSTDSRRATAAARRDTVEQQITAVTTALTGAVAAGDLPSTDTDPSEHVAAVTAKRESATTRLSDVRAARATRIDERSVLAEQRRAATGRRSAWDSERAALATEHGKLANRAATLAANDRLHELLQLDADIPVDLWADPVRLQATLTRAATDADAAVIAAGVDAAEDIRALDALATTGFLPTTRDAQRVTDALTAAGITARPGWDLLRQVLDDGSRTAALRTPALAALAAGVVVTGDDLGPARQVLTDPALTTVAHVPVATAAQLEAAVHAAPAGWAVAAPTAALFDAGAADTDRADRERRGSSREQAILAWTAQARADRELAAELQKLLTDCPAGHLDALATELREAEQAVDRLDGELADLAAQATALDDDDRADAATEMQLSTLLTDLGGRLARLTGLAAQVATLPGLRAELDELIATVTDLTGHAEQLGAEATEQEQLHTAATERAASARATAVRYGEDAAAITLLGGTPAAERAGAGEVTDDISVPLSTLQSRFATADSDWAQVTANSVLADRLARQIAREAEAARQLAGVPTDVLDLAGELLTRPEGQDVRRRADALTAARETASTASEEVGRADAEVKAAEAAVRDAAAVRERERRAAELEREPVDAADAREQAARYAAAATEASTRTTTLAREAEDARAKALEASSFAGVFGQQVQRLRDAAGPAPLDAPEAADSTPLIVGPYLGSTDDAEALVQATLGELNGAKAAAETARGKVSRAAHAVRDAAAKFTGIEDPLKERFLSDDPEQLAEFAAVRAQNLRDRRQVLLGLLADIGKDQALVVTQVAALVTDVFTTLAGAQRHSKLPGSLGEWSDQQFLTIRFTKPGSDDDLRARISAVIEQIVAEGSKPEGLSLLKRCVHEAVAPRGFTVTVLKPNSSLTVEPLDITMLGKYSGGEKLTVCVALYCTLARLRAVNRGQGHVGGTLVLDNPLGTASHVELLRLQRDVAAAHGVQLVFTTGVEDFGAVGQFPNVLRLRNSPGTLRHRRYVTVAARGGSAVDPDGDEPGITGVRVTRTGAPV